MRAKEYRFGENITYVLRNISKWEKKYIPMVLLYSLTIVINQYVPVILPKCVVDIISVEGERGRPFNIIIFFYNFENI